MSVLYRSQDKGFNTEGAITHVFHKAEIHYITIAAKDENSLCLQNNSLSDDEIY
jgi:hypothetical protein